MCSAKCTDCRLYGTLYSTMDSVNQYNLYRVVLQYSTSTRQLVNHHQRHGSEAQNTSQVSNANVQHVQLRVTSIDIIETKRTVPCSGRFLASIDPQSSDDHNGNHVDTNTKTKTRINIRKWMVVALYTSVHCFPFLVQHIEQPSVSNGIGNTYIFIYGT